MYGYVKQLRVFYSKHLLSLSNAIWSNTKTFKHESDLFFIRSVVLYK